MPTAQHVVTYSSRERNDQIIAVVEPERLGLRLDRPTVLAEPGNTATVTIEVRRGEGLKGPAKIDVEIPRGVKGVSASPATIAVDADSGALKLKFSSDARGPFPSPITIARNSHGRRQTNHCRADVATRAQTLSRLAILVILIS